MMSEISNDVEIKMDEPEETAPLTELSAVNYIRRQVILRVERLQVFHQLGHIFSLKCWLMVAYIAPPCSLSVMKPADEITIMYGVIVLGVNL